MKKLFLFLLTCSFIFANDVSIVSQNNKNGEITPKTIEEVFKKNGFYISDNRDMNGPFKNMFKNTNFDVYNLFTSYHVKSVHNLSKSYPQIGLFIPMSMSIYTRKGDNKIHIAHLTKSAMAKITGIPEDNKDLEKISQLVKKSISEALPKGKEEKIEYEIAKTNKKLVTRTSLKLSGEDWEDESETFIEEFEGMLEVKGFVQAGFTDVNYDFKKAGDDSFDLFVTESICKLPVIYTVSKTRPEAGAFAPCSLSIYKKKGENTLYMEYPNVYNWISSLSIEDKESIDALLKAQGQIENILQSLTQE